MVLMSAGWPQVRRRDAGGAHTAEIGSAISAAAYMCLLIPSVPGRSYLVDSLQGFLDPSEDCCFDGVYSWELQLANHLFSSGIPFRQSHLSHASDRRLNLISLLGTGSGTRLLIQSAAKLPKDTASPAFSLYEPFHHLLDVCSHLSPHH